MGEIWKSGTNNTPRMTLGTLSSGSSYSIEDRHCCPPVARTSTTAPGKKPRKQNTTFCLHVVKVAGLPGPSWAEEQDL